MHVSRHTGRHGMALLFMAAVVVSFSVAHDAWCQTPANGVSSPAKAGEAAGGNEVGMTLSREAPPDYVAGQSVEIVVTLNITNAAQLLAVGLYETIPEGWVFEQFRGISGSPPALAPQPGTEGTLSFAWINTPEMPCSFAYSLHTSADSVGTKMISGRAEYRTSGAAQYSEPVVTELSGTDLTPPVLTLLGDNPMSLAQGTPYAEPGCTAIDSQEGDLTAKVQITGTVDANTPGSYSISYSAKDTAGNEATAVRQVQVGAKSGEGAAEGAKEDASKSGADKFASGNTAAATNSASGDPAVPGSSQASAANTDPANPAPPVTPGAPATDKTNAASKRVSGFTVPNRPERALEVDPPEIPSLERKKGSSAKSAGAEGQSNSPSGATPTASGSGAAAIPEQTVVHLSRAQWIGLIAGLGGFAVLVFLAALAWKLAYNSSPRRRTPTPPQTK